jgi:hypothetical protein
MQQCEGAESFVILIAHFVAAVLTIFRELSFRAKIFSKWIEQ